VTRTALTAALRLNPELSLLASVKSSTVANIYFPGPGRGSVPEDSRRIVGDFWGSRVVARDSIRNKVTSKQVLMMRIRISISNLVKQATSLYLHGLSDLTAF
jgi:hypothetical protein